MALRSVKGTLEGCKHSEGWIEVRGGCWHVWGWIIVSFQACTICLFGSGLEPSPPATQSSCAGGWDPPDVQGFLWPTTMAHILGPQPTWPCLINGFERGHTLHPVQCGAHVPNHVTVRCYILFMLLPGWIFHHLFDIRYYQYLSPAFIGWTICLSLFMNSKVFLIEIKDLRTAGVVHSTDCKANWGNAICDCGQYRYNWPDYELIQEYSSA